MNPIKFECPHCHEIIAGDESLYGQRVQCQKCQAEILVPAAPARPEPQIARLIPEPAASAPIVPESADQETDIFKLSPTARAFPGQILLGLIFIALAIGLAMRAQDFSWPRWVALVPLALGVLVLLLVWIGLGSFGMKAPVLEHFRRITDTETQYRLALQREAAMGQLEKTAAVGKEE